MSVRIEFDGGAALITIDNPPVNVTSLAVRKGLMEALDAAEQAGVDRVILTGAGDAFVAGADAKEFDAPPMPPHLNDIILRLETFPVPVVAAINGVALGGGLELTLGCRMRVSAPQASMGLPEVNLGVVPGAGGTQRLPRLIGIAPALDLIATGKTIRADEALRLGLVDAIDPDPVRAARNISARDLNEQSAISALPAPAGDDLAVQTALATAAKRQKGQVAPPIAISLVARSAELPITEGLAAEREAFLERRTSDQAAALRHVFFAERAAMGLGKTGGAEMTSAVVVGGGTMGAAIAYAFAQIGLSVALVETDDAGAARASANVARLYDDAVKRGKATEEAANAMRAARHSFHVGYDNLPKVDIAVEAVFEDMGVKKQVFAALDAALGPETILATNTSYLDPNIVAEGVSNPARFLGLHFFSPAHVMKLVEVVRADKTSEATLATVLRLIKRLKKLPVLAGVCDGFIGNRILTRYRQICDVMLLEGALPAQVDSAMRQYGMAMGPYEVQDLSGLDIAYANRKRLGWASKPGHRYIAIADRVVDETGRLGRKTGAGWYDYDTGKATPSAIIDQIVISESVAAGQARRSFSDEEIVARARAAMVSEGLSILQEGIAATPAAIDLVLVHGYGFPRWRGGPMHEAERQGLAGFMTGLEAYAAEDPLSWAVPDLLRQAVSEGLSLENLTRKK